MDDCGDAITHKHSLPQRLLLYLYVQGYNFEISKVKEKKGYIYCGDDDRKVLHRNSWQ